MIVILKKFLFETIILIFILLCPELIITVIYCKIILMIHILRHHITDKIFRFIINFHIIGISLLKCLRPVIHPGHQNPSFLPLIHADTSGIRQ